MRSRAAVRKIGEFTGWTGSWSSATVGGESQQPTNANRSGCEDRDFAECVERPEVDQDDVDDVAPVTQGRSELGEVLPQSPGPSPSSRWTRAVRQ